jgi:hypothetical protein
MFAAPEELISKSPWYSSWAAVVFIGLEANISVDEVIIVSLLSIELTGRFCSSDGTGVQAVILIADLLGLSPGLIAIHCIQFEGMLFSSWLVGNPEVMRNRVY